MAGCISLNSCFTGPLPHEIADHLFDIQKVLSSRQNGRSSFHFHVGRRLLCWLIGPHVDWKNVQDGLLKCRARGGTYTDSAIREVMVLVGAPENGVERPY